MVVRIPISVASKRGVSHLATAAAEDRLVLTSHGRPVAVVDSAERLDEDARTMREAATLVIDGAAHRLSERSAHFDLAAACDQLGIDVDRVLARAAELKNGA